MNSKKESTRQLGASGDRGFSGRASLDEATGWIDAHGARLGEEEIGLRGAAGRVLASPLTAASDLPPYDCAGVDGYAVRAGETVGAGDYNPLFLALGTAQDLSPGSAMPVVAGTPLPRGADAILPFESARESDQKSGAALEVFEAVAEGWGIVRKGQQVQAGTMLAPSARRLLPQDIGLLASLGVERVRVVARPRVHLIVNAPKGLGQSDANGPMLRALVERDGGLVVGTEVREGEGRRQINDPTQANERIEWAAHALAAVRGADVVIMAGRSGMGWDDDAGAAIAQAGELSIHGIALQPGASAGMGVVGSTPVLLLPGEPLACLCAYDMLAGRLIRRLGGGGVELPYGAVDAEVGRKIVSSIGMVDLYRVRIVKGIIEPIGSGESGGVASAVRADGFVIIPAALEGYAPGARVRVHLYGTGGGG